MYIRNLIKLFIYTTEKCHMRLIFLQDIKKKKKKIANS